MKVFEDQKAQFESQEVFRRLNRETEIKCIDFRDTSGPERQSKIIDRAKCSGHLDIAFVCNGTHLRLHFHHWRNNNTAASACPSREFIDFEKEPGRMHFKSPVIYNGVCVYCIGFINLTKFDGAAKLEFDAQFAQYEKERSGGGVIVNNSRETKSESLRQTHLQQQLPTSYTSQSVPTIVPNVKFEPTA